MYILIQKSVLLTYLYYYYKRLTLNGVNVLSRNHSLPNKKKNIARCGSPSFELLVRGVPETPKAI